MKYDELVKSETKKGINIVEASFKGHAKGYYCDSFIVINNKIDTDTEKKCILAEELGHHYTSSGNILEKSIISIKQEHTARRWASEKLIDIGEIINGLELGITSRHELAEYLDVTEEFFEEAITYFKQKYGTHLEIDNYIMYFEPYFKVIKLV